MHSLVLENIKKMAHDPLSMLRRFTTKRKLSKVRDEDGTLHFGDIKFAKQTPTRLRTHGSNHYSLGSLYLFFLHRKDKHTAYMKVCKEQNLVPVSLPQKRKVLAYLSGTADSIENLDPLPAQTKNLKTEQKSVELETKTGHENNSGTGRENVAQVATTKFLVDSSFSNVLRKELILNNRCTVLLGLQNYSHLLAAVQTLFTVDSKRSSEKRQSKTQQMRENKRMRLEASKTAAAAASGGTKPGAPESQQPAPQANMQSHPRSPIIVVPAAISAMLTMYNVRSFLEDATYITSAKAKKSGTKKQRHLRIKHTFKDGKTIHFRVVDMVNMLSSSELKRIAVVVVAGPEWQFKGWRLGSTANIFARVKGIHLHFDSTVPPATVKQWKVASLMLSKNKRHLDNIANNEFWAMVDNFLRRRRPEFFGFESSEKHTVTARRRRT